MTAITDHYLGIDVHKRGAQVAVLGEIAQKYVGRSATLEDPEAVHDRVGNPKAREIAPESWKLYSL